MIFWVVVSNIIFFLPLLGEMIQFDLSIFFRWVGSTITSFFLLIWKMIFPESLPNSQLLEDGLPGKFKVDTQDDVFFKCISFEIGLFWVSMFNFKGVLGGSSQVSFQW